MTGRCLSEFCLDASYEVLERQFDLRFGKVGSRIEVGVQARNTLLDDALDLVHQSALWVSSEAVVVASSLWGEQQVLSHGSILSTSCW